MLPIWVVSNYSTLRTSVVITKPLPINVYIVDFPGLGPRNEITGTKVASYVFQINHDLLLLVLFFSHGLVT